MSSPAQQAVDHAPEGAWIIGWKLDPEQRRELLMQFPPRYDRIVADHVTLASRVAADAQPPSSTTAEIVGRADDDAGVEALIVRIDGETDRPGGGTYHITWSLDGASGRTAKESNDVIAQRGWKAVELPMPVLLAAALWLRGGGNGQNG